MTRQAIVQSKTTHTCPAAIVAGGQNDTMAVSRVDLPHITTDTAAVPLTEAEQTLYDASAEAVIKFRELALCWRNNDQDHLIAATEAFDQACGVMGVAANKANPISVISRKGDAGLAVLALVVERYNLGLPLVLTDPATGDLFPIDGAPLTGVSDLLIDVEGMALADRIVAYVGDSTVAPLIVGSHLAREGRNDPFCGDPWVSPDLGTSLAAAAIATVTLTQVARAIGVEPAQFGSLTAGSLAASVKAAGAAYHALDDDDRLDLVGFGLGSRIIEDILLGADFLDEATDADIHRASGRLTSAYVDGFGGLVLDMGSERDDVVSSLLIASHASGFAAGRDSTLATCVVTTTVFGSLPGVNKVQ